MKDLKYSILINKASKQFGERGFECMLAVVLVLGALALVMFVPVAGVALAFLVAPFLCVGLKKYLISISKDEIIPIESVFLEYKVALKAFCLKVAYTLISFLWGIVFIIPGIICAVNYSMASFVMAEDNSLGSLECMAVSKKLVSGNRAEIFIIYLAYFFVTIASLCIFTVLGIAIKMYTSAPLWVPIVLMIVAFLFVLIIFIIPYFELVLTNVYTELKNYQIKKNTHKTTQNTSTSKTVSSRTSTKKQTAS